MMHQLHGCLILVLELLELPSVWSELVDFVTKVLTTNCPHNLLNFFIHVIWWWLSLLHLGIHGWQQNNVINKNSDGLGKNGYGHNVHMHTCWLCCMSAILVCVHVCLYACLHACQSVCNNNCHFALCRDTYTCLSCLNCLVCMRDNIYMYMCICNDVCIIVCLHVCLYIALIKAWHTQERQHMWPHSIYA